MKKKLLISFFSLTLWFLLFNEEDIKASGIVNPDQMYTYEQMEKDLHKLVERYPNLMELHVIGESVYKRKLYAISVGKGTPTIFVNGSHHAREWMTTTLNMYYIEKYAETYYGKQYLDKYNIRQLLNDTTIWFVPMVNPDGVTLQQKGLSAFPSTSHASLKQINNGSTNFTSWKANGRGVDLNRQYDALWSAIPANPGKPSYMNYKGPAPYSEPEAQAIRDFTIKIDPEVAIAYHSSGKIIYWNFLQTGSIYSRDHVYANQMASLTGYNLVYPKRITSGGGYTDWFVSHFKRPGYTPEIGNYPGQRHLPLSEFTTVWKENRLVPAHAATMAIDLYKKRFGLLGLPIPLIKDGEPVTTDVPAQIINGKTFVPLRFFSEQMGATIKWEQTKKRVTLIRDKTQLILSVGNKHGAINGTAKIWGEAPVEVNGRVLVPIRTISESFGVTIFWDAKTNTVHF
ncbi:M14 family zinc carboxypeptidase [Mangrovibacillus cuniculi]|uniref:Gamma-D-glutamyl-meso-diaminopimelate peptidase n=1 Tax=Mangrovibacillus cuniculi TaxID=2593652 RepID=A0A7S8CCP0_9BACI|nr:M14 family zinc carboxypeptidase [Mangrovibacillus cuniculi]QPC47567.1 gamma-D-glutamyl-meso-diaminopimelate peptidase [Mangrovibacillus cuniculi]